jgi:hypothetical protein
MVVGADIVVQNTINYQIRVQGTSKIGVLGVHNKPGTIGISVFSLGAIREPFIC